MSRKYRLSALIFFLILLISGFINLLSAKGIPVERRLSVEQVIKKTFEADKNKALLIDVRNIEENEAVRIPGSFHLPLEKIKKGKFEFDKKRDLIFYCVSGPRAEIAFNLFKKKGYKNIYVLEGGLQAWIDKQAPLVTPKVIKWELGKGCES